MKTTNLHKIIAICLFMIMRTLTSTAGLALEISPESIDLGDISKGAIIKKEILIKNNEGQTITLEKVRASCECIRIGYDKETLIKSKDSYIATLIIDTSKLPKGKMIKFIFLSLKNSAEPIFSIDIKGNIILP